MIRWVAPYSGTIAATATAKRVRLGGTGNVAVDFWHQDTMLAEAGLPAESISAFTLADDRQVDVRAGEALYIRVVGSAEDVGRNGELFEEVDARVHVDYLCLGLDCTPLPGGLSTAAKEPTGESVFSFDSHDDFRIAGKPMPVLMPVAGTIDIRGLLDKYPSDADLRVCVQLYAPSVPQAQMDVPCNINTPDVVSYYAPKFIEASFDGTIACDTTDTSP